MCDLECDFVICGAGAAGCLMAGRLYDAGFSVVLIETGENRSQDRIIRDSSFAGLEFGLEENTLPVYLYERIPINNGSLIKSQEDPSHAIKAGCNPVTIAGINGASDLGPAMVGIYSTGRVLGGGSSINGQQSVRSTVYDKWVPIGGHQWSNDEVYQRLKHLEHYHGLKGHGSEHGTKGSLSIRQAPTTPTVMATKFVQALQLGTGIQEIKFDDYNSPLTPFGSFTRWQLFQKPDGSRESSDTAFLPEEILKSGHDADEAETEDQRLLTLFKAKVLRILWHKERCKHGKPVAAGVSVIHNGDPRKVYARKRVIITAGIFSAELLQRSGVGPRPLLSCLKVPVMVDSPHVGRNFRNHLIVPIMFSAAPEDVGIPPEDEAALYTGGCFLKPLLKEDDPTLRGYQLIGGWPQPGQFLILLIYLQPHSKGMIQIQSSDPNRDALVDNNYLGDPLDTKAFIAAIREYIVPLNDGFKKVDPRYALQSPDLDTINDDDALAKFINDNFTHTHHWTGSCSMGHSIDDGVVDGYGRVFKASHLIVADISIAPTQPDGNTNYGAYAVAATIAEHLIKR